MRKVFIFFTISLLISCNEVTLNDYWNEISIVHGLSKPLPSNIHKISDNNKVDIVISIDNSYSMKPQHTSLKNNFNSFVENLDPTLDVRIALTTSDGIIKNSNNKCPSSSKPIEIAGGKCFEQNLNYSNLSDMIKYVNSNSSDYIGESGCPFEAPIFYGLYTFIEDPGNCLRDSNNKIIIVITDEDERISGKEKSISSTLEKEYLKELKANNIIVYSISHGTTKTIPESEMGDHSHSITRIVEELGGKDYDIDEDYGKHMLDFSKKINRFILKYKFFNRLDDDIEDVILYKKSKVGSNFKLIDKSQYTIEKIDEESFFVNFISSASISGSDIIKAEFPDKNQIDITIDLSNASSISSEKIEIYVDNVLIAPSEYDVNTETRTITIPKELKIRNGANILVRYVDLKV